jgi:hypothetical protein
MEKHERLNDLRKGKLPEGFYKKYSKLSELILQISHHNVNVRLDSKNLITSIENELLQLENIPYTKKSRNRFYSDDINEKSYLFDFQLVDLNLTEKINAIVSSNKLFIFPFQSKKALYAYDLIESTMNYTIRDSIIELNIEHPLMNNCKLKSIYNDDSWEFVKNLTGRNL